MLRYPVILVPDTNDTILVDFPDVPEAHTFGDDRAEALRRAPDALACAFGGRIAFRERIPEPSVPKRGQPTVALSALVEAKLRLYSAMRAARVSKAELSRRLDCHMPQVDRLLDLYHNSKFDQLEAAFKALSKRLAVVVEDAA